MIRPGVLAAPRTPDPNYERLTPREKQILELAAQGESNKAIAALLDVSENTVAVAGLAALLGMPSYNGQIRETE